MSCTLTIDPFFNSLKKSIYVSKCSSNINCQVGSLDKIYKAKEVKTLKISYGGKPSLNKYKSYYKFCLVLVGEKDYGDKTHLSLCHYMSKFLVKALTIEDVQTRFLGVHMDC